MRTLEDIMVTADSDASNEVITHKTLMDLGDQVFRKALFKAHKASCFLTNSPLKIEDMHIDHLHPRDKGGTDRLDNLVPSYSKRNLDKGDRYDKEIVDRLIDTNRLIYVPRVIAILENIKSKGISRKPRSPEFVQACNIIYILLEDDPTKLYTEDELNKELGEQSIEFNKIKKYLIDNHILKRIRVQNTYKYCHISKQDSKDEFYNAIVEYIRSEYIYDGLISPIKSYLGSLGIKNYTKLNKDDIDYLVDRGELIRTEKGELSVKEKRTLPLGIVYNKNEYEIHWIVIQMGKPIDKKEIYNSFPRLSNAIKVQESFLKKLKYTYHESERVKNLYELPEVEALYVEMNECWWYGGIFSGRVNVARLGSIEVNADSIFSLLSKMDEVVQLLKTVDDEIKSLRTEKYRLEDTIRELEQKIKILKEP